MAPGRLALHATSVLDREMFNEEKEEAWRNHFELKNSQIGSSRRSTRRCFAPDMRWHGATRNPAIQGPVEQARHEEM